MKAGVQHSNSVSVNRRLFLHNTAGSVLAAALSGCKAKQSVLSNRDSTGIPQQPAPVQRASLAEGRPREEVIDLVDAKADYYMRLCHNCAQTSFLALEEVFAFGDPSFAKALTPLPGIAERGETCGAVIGCLLALGFVFGRDRLNDWAGWRACLVPARKFCQQFENEMGSTMCGDIVEKLFGRRYDLSNPADLGQFQAANPTEKCAGVVRKSVRIAAGLILDRG